MYVVDGRTFVKSQTRRRSALVGSLSSSTRPLSPRLIWPAVRAPERSVSTRHRSSGNLQAAGTTELLQELGEEFGLLVRILDLLGCDAGDENDKVSSSEVSSDRHSLAG